MTTSLAEMSHVTLQKKFTLEIIVANDTEDVKLILKMVQFPRPMTSGNIIRRFW